MSTDVGLGEGGSGRCELVPGLPCEWSQGARAWSITSELGVGGSSCRGGSDAADGEQGQQIAQSVQDIGPPLVSSALM